MGFFWFETRRTSRKADSIAIKSTELWVVGRWQACPEQMKTDPGLLSWNVCRLVVVVGVFVGQLLFFFWKRGHER